MYNDVVIIQCAGRKKRNPLWGINFVAHPQDPDEHHPDGTMSSITDVSWRKYIEEYNNGLYKEHNQKLCKAGDLYLPKYYKAAINKLGWDRVYILSAGWGLIRSDYFIPSYDITFSSSAPRKNKRTIKTPFADWNQLKDCKRFFFFGGINYLLFLYKLTQNLDCEKIVYYAADKVVNDAIWQFEGYTYVKYKKSFTNWHYQALSDWLDGTI